MTALHTQRFVKRPVEIDAVQWFQNGDHPEDCVGEILTDPLGGPDYARLEGAIVRFFRLPDPEYAGQKVHDLCGRIWHDHGWIDTLEGGHTVCPGDWIITGVKGEHYPCKPDIFEMTYDPVFTDDEIDAQMAAAQQKLRDEVAQVPGQWLLSTLSHEPPQVHGQLNLFE